MPYDNGQEKLGNLGTKNATGFTHADMEELMKGAWQIVCNNTSEYPNAEAGGVQYLYPILTHRIIVHVLKETGIICWGRH